MPKLEGDDYCAQRVRYPNGTTSVPFVVSCSKITMTRLAAHLHQSADWRRAEEQDGFDPGSSRLACAYDGRFWATLRIWLRHICDYSGDTLAEPFGRLSMVHMQLLLGPDDEFGWRVLNTLGWIGRFGPFDPVHALARTVIAWAEQIEEWSDP